MLDRYLQNEHLPKRVLWALIFAVIFSVVGRAVPVTYYQFFDTTEYLSIDSPISVDKAYYKPGDLVMVSAGVEAQIDVQAMVLTELVLVKQGSGDYIRVDGSQIVQEAPFRKQDHHIVSNYLKLPNNLPDGSYYWKGNATYYIRGIERTESYISQTFNVTQSGLSPAGQDLQDQINELK